jgi:hypothetical protein
MIFVMILEVVFPPLQTHPPKMNKKTKGQNLISIFLKQGKDVFNKYYHLILLGIF